MPNRGLPAHDLVFVTLLLHPVGRTLFVAITQHLLTNRLFVDDHLNQELDLLPIVRIHCLEKPTTRYQYQ